jgi:RecA/RadA recombinase
LIEIYGGEGTGKCVTGDTLITIPGEGILTMEEINRTIPWKTDREVQGDTHEVLNKSICSVAGETNASHFYYAGKLQTQKVYTEQGHNISGSLSHRMLTLAENGIARWVTLQNMRAGDTLISMVGNKVSGGGDIKTPWFNGSELSLDSEDHLCLAGALCSAEDRTQDLWIGTITTVQRQLIQKWIKSLFPDDITLEKLNIYTKFTGLLKLSPQIREFQKSVTSSVFLSRLRKAKPELQLAWLAGLTTINGKWTKSHLEIEISNEEVSRVFQAISENHGVRWVRYATLNTFGDIRYKLALRSRLDQQQAEALLWKNRYKPSTWVKKYSDEEDENPARARLTLQAAKAILEKKGIEFKDIEEDDLSKDNMKEVYERLKSNAKSQRDQRVLETLDLLANDNVSFDRVTGVEQGEVKPCYDFSVPIGHNYSANGLISHNSTLAMHYCNQELSTYPDSTCLYLDYERAMAKAYAKRMGLLRFAHRFQILDLDTLEEGGKLIEDLFKEGIIPSIVVIDSIAAMTPADLYGRDMEDAAPIGLQARKLSELLSKWSKTFGDYGTTGILLNQTRAFISTERRFMGNGLMVRQVPGAQGSEKEDTPGGKAVKFYTSQRLRLEVKKTIKTKVFNPMLGEESEVPVANIVKVTAAKNKLVQPYRQGTFYIEFGKGIDNIRTLIEVGETQKFITRSGSRIALNLPSGEELKAVGEVNFYNSLKSRPDLQKELMKVLRWEAAEELTEAIGETITEVLDPTETEVQDKFIQEIKNIKEGGLTVNILEQSPFLTTKAQLLGLLDPNLGKVFGYTPLGGEQIRAKTAEGLMQKLTPKMQEELREKVVRYTKALSALERGVIPGEDEEDDDLTGAQESEKIDI